MSKPTNIQTRWGAFFGDDGEVVTASAKFKECAHSWRFIQPKGRGAIVNLAFDCREIFHSIPGHETEREAVDDLIKRSQREEERIRILNARIVYRISNAVIWIRNNNLINSKESQS